MEPEVSLPCLQGSATDPYSEPDKFSHYPQTQFFKMQFNIISSSAPRSPKWCVHFRFPTEILHVFIVCPIRAT
jgi:hypothetical protein